MPCHPSHKTRMSLDASSYDEICVNCGATDIAGGGWGKLAEPCPAAPPEALRRIIEEVRVDKRGSTGYNRTYHRHNR